MHFDFNELNTCFALRVVTTVTIITYAEEREDKMQQESVSKIKKRPLLFERSFYIHKKSAPSEPVNHKPLIKRELTLYSS